MRDESEGNVRRRTARVVARVRREVRWQADRVVVKGAFQVLATLALTMASLALVGGAIRWLAVSDRPSVSDALWAGVSRVLDLSSLQQESEWAPRAIGLAMVLLGLLGSALVTAIVVTAFQGALERVRNGRTEVRGRPQLLILGWSEEITTLLKEVHEGAGGDLTVAVLSRRARTEMDTRIKSECGPRLRAGLTVHCRTGDRTRPSDLALVDLSSAATVIVLSESEDEIDADVVKTVFSCLQAGLDFDRQALIAEVSNGDAARAMRMVTGDRIRTVNSAEILSLILAQGVRDQGMGQVFQQLMSYAGVEIYFAPIPVNKAGATFGDLVVGARNNVPIGLRRGDRVDVLPSLTRRVELGEEVVFLSGVEVVPEFKAQASEVDLAPSPPAPVWGRQRVLVIGWNRVFARSASHVRNFLSPDSELVVCVDTSVIGIQERRTLELSAAVTRFELAANTSEMLQQVRFEVDNGTFDAVALVPYREDLDPTHADAETLIALAGVRLALRSHASAGTRVLAELRETRAAELALLVNPDDLILSDALTSSLIAQLSDRPALDGVLADLLDYHGAAIFVHPLERWPALERLGVVRFDEVVEHVAAQGEIALGLRLNGSMEMNPDRTAEHPTGVISGVVVLGAGVDWGRDAVQSRIADLGE